MAATQQLTVTANYGSGKSVDVTESATYSSTNESVATVSATGLITAVGEGTATINVSYEGASGTCAVTVIDPLEGINVEPSSAVLELEE